MTDARRRRHTDARAAAATLRVAPIPTLTRTRRHTQSSLAASSCHSLNASSRRFFAALLVVLCSASAARAATLDEYRARVREAITAVERLHETDDQSEWEDEDARREYEAEAVTKLRSLLPARERVERANGAVEVDNGWLHKELDAYGALARDSEEKHKKINLLADRLNSLAGRLDEEAAAAQAARDKEAEKGRLQSILRRPEYQEEAAKGGALQNLLEWLSELIESLFPKRPAVSSGTSSLFSVVARIFVFALAVGLIIFLAVRYGPRLLGRIGTSGRAKAREARVVLGERLAPDQTSSDLIAEAERLARAGDVRGAIRKAYVAVLCELGDRHLIRLAQHKTNRDYLASLRDRAELYGVMHPLTHTFERHWYGFAPATDADWADYRALCNRAISDE